MDLSRSLWFFSCSLYRYIFACTCLYEWVCIYMCMHVYIYVSVCMHIYILCVCMYIYMYICMCVYVCIYVHMYMYIMCVYVCVCVYMCVYICVYIYIHKYISFLLSIFCVYIYIYIYIFIYGIVFNTTNFTYSWPPLSLETPDTRKIIWCIQENTKLHENRRSNPWAYTPTKTHIHTTINKSSLLTKLMQIFILQIHDQVHQKIHLPIQQKHDTKPLRSHIN